MFRTNYERVLAYTLRRADAADVEDIVAETFAVAWRRWDDVPTDPLPWLYAVARRVLANSRRSVRRRAQLAARILAEDRPSSLVDRDPGERLEEAIAMRSALLNLSAVDREALMLVAWEGLDNGQASLVVGVSPETFAVRLHRARKRLDAEVERLSGEQGPGDGTRMEES